MAGNVGMTVGLTFKSFSEELFYNNELAQTIRPVFVKCIPAVEFTDLECISAKLTEEDMQRVKRKHDHEGSHASAGLLLDTLRMKPSWFIAFLQALDSRELKLAEFKPRFLQLKEELDKEWIEKYSCVSSSRSARPAVSVSPDAHSADGSNATANDFAFGELPQVVNPSGFSWSQCSSQSVHESRGSERNMPTSEETVPKALRGSAVYREAPQDRLDNDDEDGYDHLMHPSLPSERWFHGNMTRGLAQDILKHHCQQSFLVRFSAERGHFCLSVVGHTKVLNLKINEKKLQGVTHYHVDSDQEGFKTITDLVNYFTNHPLPTHDGILYLCNPVFRGAEIGDVLLHNGSATAHGARSESNI